MSIMPILESLEDTRSHINRSHELLDIVFLTLSALMSGAEGWQGIQRFGEAKLDWLRQYRPFTNGIPTRHSIARIIRTIKPEKLVECFVDWVNQTREATGKELIAIDGKTLRRSYKDQHTQALHLVSAMAVKQGLVLYQQESQGKKNEIKTVQAMLQILELKDSVVTLDAMHCQTHTAQLIRAGQGDYLLQVKENQGNLYKELQAYFHRAHRDNPKQVKQGYYEEVDKGHGRVEHRCYTQLEVTDWITNIDKWQDLKTVIEVTRARHIKGQQEQETSYYISSLPIEPSFIAWTIRGYWRIENCQHWVLDMVFREDDSTIYAGDGPENMALFRRLLLNLARQNSKRDSMKGKLQRAAWDDQFRAELLFGQNMS